MIEYWIARAMGLIILLCAKSVAATAGYENTTLQKTIQRGANKIQLARYDQRMWQKHFEDNTCCFF